MTPPWVAAILAALLLGNAAAPGQGDTASRVVLVVLGGGVRSRDVLDRPDLCPNLTAIAAKGVSVPAVKVPNLEGDAALRSVIVGSSEGDLTTHRTLTQVLRSDGGLPYGEVWTIASGIPATTALRPSPNPSSASNAGVLVALDAIPTSILDAALRQIGLTHPADEPEVVRAATAQFVRALGAPRDDLDIGPRGRQVLAQIHDENRTPPPSDTGPGVSDQRALAAGLRILGQIQPRCLLVVLGDARVAARSLSDYERVLRQNDAGIGTLWSEIEGNPNLRSSTTLVVVSDHGRNRKEDKGGALGSDDGTADATRVAMILAGPAIREKERLRISVQTTDVAPTVCHLLGITTDQFRGRVLRAALR